MVDIFDTTRETIPTASEQRHISYANIGKIVYSIALMGIGRADGRPVGLAGRRGSGGENSMAAIKVIDIIVERKGMILLIKREDFWILPGGEIEPGDDEMLCLEDVVSREMNDRISCIFKKLEKTITGMSPVRGGEVEVTIYVGDISSAKMSDVKGCNAHWFSRQSISSLRLSNITKDVLKYYFSLDEDGKQILQ